MPLRNVSVLKDKKFSTENRDITLRSINFSNTPNRSKTKGFPYENFRLFDTINFRRKISMFPPHPFLFINYFATRNFLQHSQKGSSFFYGKLRYCETKNFREKNVTYPSEAKLFSAPDINERLKSFPTKLFSTVRQKIFDRKS